MVPPRKTKAVTAAVTRKRELGKCGITWLDTLLIARDAGMDPVTALIATGKRSDPLDQLLIWRMNDPRYETRETRLKGQAMQRQWTIEARADFADKEKNDMITEAVHRAAVHINATIALIADGVKPQVVAFSDDFFAGHEDIALIPDKLGQALADHDDGKGDAVVSDEMAQAARDMLHDKNNAR